MVKHMDPIGEIGWTIMVDNSQSNALKKILPQLPTLFSEHFVLGLDIHNGSRDAMSFARKHAQKTAHPLKRMGEWPVPMYSWFKSNDIAYQEMLHYLHDTWFDVLSLFVRVNDKYHMAAWEMNSKRFNLFLSTSYSHSQIRRLCETLGAPGQMHAGQSLGF